MVYRGFKTCAMVGVWPTFGYNRYRVMDFDNRASITAYVHELAPASLDNMVLEGVEFVDLEGLGLQPPKKRFKELSTNEIEKLAAQRTEKSTDRQTNWAVKLFRGKILTTGRLVYLTARGRKWPCFDSFELPVTSDPFRLRITWPTRRSKFSPKSVAHEVNVALVRRKRTYRHRL